MLLLLLLVPLLLAVLPLALAAAGVGMFGWLVTYFAVLAGLAVAFRAGLREQPKRHDRRLG